jgi:hypothetical protein
MGITDVAEGIDVRIDAAQDLGYLLADFFNQFVFLCLPVISERS